MNSVWVAGDIWLLTFWFKTMQIALTITNPSQTGSGTSMKIGKQKTMNIKYNSCQWRTGFCIRLKRDRGTNCLSDWRWHLQGHIDLSTCESEIAAVLSCLKSAMRFQMILSTVFKRQVKCTVLTNYRRFVDSFVCCLSQNPSRILD